MQTVTRMKWSGLVNDKYSTHLNYYLIVLPFHSDKHSKFNCKRLKSRIVRIGLEENASQFEGRDGSTVVYSYLQHHSVTNDWLFLQQTVTSNNYAFRVRFEIYDHIDVSTQIYLQLKHSLPPEPNTNSQHINY